MNIHVVEKKHNLIQDSRTYKTFKHISMHQKSQQLLRCIIVVENVSAKFWYNKFSADAPTWECYPGTPKGARMHIYNPHWSCFSRFNKRQMIMPSCFSLVPSGTQSFLVLSQMQWQRSIMFIMFSLSMFDVLAPCSRGTNGLAICLSCCVSALI